MSFLPSPFSMNCTVPSPWTRLKTSQSSSRPSPHSSTFHCKILCYLSATHALHPIISYCPLIWILVPLRDALKTPDFRLFLPAISRLQSKIPQLLTLKEGLLPCHLMQKFPQHGTVSGIKADIRDPILQDQFFIPAKLIVTVFQTCALSSAIILLLFMPLPPPGMHSPSSLLPPIK